MEFHSPTIMLAKLAYIRELEDHSRMYTLTNRLLDSFGYSQENRLHPREFNDFINRAMDERGATYAALENIVEEIQRYNQPKTLGRKIANGVFEGFTLPMQALMYLKDRVWSGTGSKMAGLLSVVAVCWGTGAAISYSADKLDIPGLSTILHGWLIAQFFVFVIAARDVLKYNLSDPDVNPVFERLEEIKGSLLQKVKPGYDLIEDIKHNFTNKE